MTTDTTTNTHSDTVEIPELDAESINMAVSLFGVICNTNPQLAGLMNHFGPMLCAALLYTYSEGYDIDPADSENLIATRSTTEAESHAIGWVRAVATANGLANGDLSVSPSDAEVEADTDITPVV